MTPDHPDPEWAINVRTLQAPQSGVQRYAHELVGRLGSRVRRLAPRIGHQGTLGHAWEQLVLPFYCRGRLLFSPGNTGPLACRRQVVTIHDASTFDFPSAFAGLFGSWYRWLLPRLARRCLGIVTVSAFSRDRLAATLGIDRSRIAVVYNGVTPPPTSASPATTEAVRRQFGLPARFLLCVGSNDPRKNLSRLIRAFSASDCAGLGLVLAGGSNAQLFSECPSIPSQQGVQALGHVSDEVLEALYSLAEGFVFPSLYEGFGLPPLEAMARGCPVLCSNATCLPEVCGPSFDEGGAPLYFSPQDEADMAAAIRRFAQMSAEERARMRASGFQWVAGFTWDQCAKETAAALERFDRGVLGVAQSLSPQEPTEKAGNLRP